MGEEVTEVMGMGIFFQLYNWVCGKEFHTHTHKMTPDSLTFSEELLYNSVWCEGESWICSLLENLN